MRIPSNIQKYIDRFQEAEVPTRAAALAFHTLLAIVPTIGIIFWYLKKINIMEEWGNQVRDFILGQLNFSSSEIFLEHFERLTGHVESEGWGWIGLGLFVYTAASLVIKFGRSLDCILKFREEPLRSVSFWILFARRTGAMLGLPIALMISLAVSQWIRHDSWLRVIFELQGVGPIIALPFAWLANILAAFFVYYLIPSKPVPAAEALKAALVIVPISEALKWGLGVYNHYAIGTSKLYGVLAIVPLFILWVQLSWAVLLSGALLIRTKKRR